MSPGDDMKLTRILQLGLTFLDYLSHVTRKSVFGVFRRGKTQTSLLTYSLI